MTEAERIVKEGIVPKDFLKEEIRCDFLVNTELKKLWAVSIDMLINLDAVCKKYELQYYMAAGSLLGTVRHGGFIPWDDDIDVFMMRKDYDRFFKVAIDEMKDPYFVQTPETDPAFLYSCNRIRNSRTTACIYTFRHAGYNQGMWLSVFPLDNFVFDSTEEDRFEKAKSLNREKSAHMRRMNPNPTEADTQRLSEYPYRNPKEVVNELRQLELQFNNQPADYLSCVATTSIHWSKLTFKKSDFAFPVMRDFEGIIQVPIPNGYDGILRTEYGNYMEYPPHEIRGHKHDGTIFDMDRPYTELKIV